MANLSISVLNKENEVKCQTDGVDELWLVHQGKYEPGDKIVFHTDEKPAFYVIRLDGAMDEAYVYLTQARVEYAIPFEKTEFSQTDRISYSPGCFMGVYHYITMRKTRPEENGNYRNLAKNIMDQRDSAGCYPHVRANAETQGPVAPLFAARNVIDGVLANSSHYPWPFQSWGIDQRADAEITVEFGRAVDMDELRLTTRADFPHDSWWTQATVTFSDGTLEVVELGKRVEPQAFPIQRNRITWLKIGQLIKADDPSLFPALTQIEVFGRNSQE